MKHLVKCLCNYVTKYLQIFMNISVIANWFSNSSNIENTLLSPLIGSLSNISVAIGTIILAILTYKSIIEPKNQYKTDILRGKAIQINAKTIPLLKKKIEELSSYIDKKEFIKFESGRLDPSLKITSNCFIDILKEDVIFNIVNEEIYLIYTADDYLKKHMGSAITFINMYHKNALELERLVNIVLNSEIPDSFSKYLEKLGFPELINTTNSLGRVRNFVSLVYIVSVTGSSKAYTSGRVTIIDLIKDRYNDLNSAALEDSESRHIFEEIQTKIHELDSNLNNAYGEIQKLEKIWQNKYVM